VVVSIDVLPVPARRKHEFYSDSVGAVLVQIALLGHVVAIEGTLGLFAVAEAVEAKSALSEINLGRLTKLCPVRLFRVCILGVRARDGVVAAKTVSSDHAEARWECCDLAIGVVRIFVEKVVADER